MLCLISRVQASTNADIHFPLQFAIRYFKEVLSIYKLHEKVELSSTFILVTIRNKRNISTWRILSPRFYALSFTQESKLNRAASLHIHRRHKLPSKWKCIERRSYIPRRYYAQNVKDRSCFNLFWKQTLWQDGSHLLCVWFVLPGDDVYLDTPWGFVSYRTLQTEKSVQYFT
jgi:hypothetical protein